MTRLFLARSQTFLPTAGLDSLGQWFSNLFRGTPALAFLPHLTHLIPLVSSLVETARPELGMSYKGDIQIVNLPLQCKNVLVRVCVCVCLFHTFFVCSHV